MAKVNVIIPTYNRGRYISKAIESVLRQKYKNFELIVVDDGSTDETQAVLQRFEDKIRIICQANAGVSSARNTGIRVADCEWLAFLDSDDEWSPDYLSVQMEHLEGCPKGICMQSTNCRFIGLDGQEIEYYDLNGAVSEFGAKEYLYLKKPFRCVMSHAPWQVGSTIFSSAAIQGAGLFDPSLNISEDLDFMARMALQGGMGLIRGVWVNIHRRREGAPSLTQRADDAPFEARESKERIFKKLEAIETLSGGDRQVLKALMSANRRALGNLLIENGARRKAREYYRQALATDHSVRSLFRYVISFAPSHHGMRQV